MKVVRWIIIILLLAGGAVLCFFRWNAWFGMPAEPAYHSDTLTYRFSCFGDDTVPGFIPTQEGWQDLRQPDVLRLIILGDVHNHMDSADYAAILAHTDTVDAYAQLGDWMERSYFYYEQQLFHQLQGTGFDTLPVMSCPGNHEYIKGLIPHLSERWLPLFRHPMNGPERFIGSTYYVDFPHLRFIALDTQGLRRLSDFTIVNVWLKRVLRSAGERYTVVMMHHPVYSSGKGRFNVAVWLAFHSVLSEADLVLSGHDHNHMQRRHFITTNSSRKNYAGHGETAPGDAHRRSRLYEVLEVSADTLRISTFSQDSLDNIQTFQVVPLVQDSAAVAQ